MLEHSFVVSKHLKVDFNLDVTFAFQLSTKVNDDDDQRSGCMKDLCSISLFKHS